MAVNLQKGQKVDLTKGNPGLKHIMVGLGWDEVQRGGFFSRPQDIDCDASAILLSENGKLTSNKDVVYFGNLKHSSNSVKHMGDNLTGAGEGDDEQIYVDLASVPSYCSKIVFVVNIYQARERRQDFGMIKNAFIRLVDSDRRSELCRYDLSENYKGMTAMIFGEIYRYNGEWKFSAIGQATNDNSIGDLAHRYL